MTNATTFSLTVLGILGSSSPSPAKNIIAINVRSLAHSRLGWMLAVVVATGILGQDEVLGGEPVRGVWREQSFDEKMA
jgi:hypothetical protein